MKFKFSAVITKGDIAYVASCPELGVVSQGNNEETALENLKEAIELYLEDEDVRNNLTKNPVKKAKITTLSISA